MMAGIYCPLYYNKKEQFKGFFNTGRKKFFSDEDIIQNINMGFKNYNYKKKLSVQRWFQMLMTNLVFLGKQTVRASSYICHFLEAGEHDLSDKTQDRQPSKQRESPI